jgi:hypothetical protein
MRFLSHLVFVALAGLLAVGCSATSPQLKVLGVGQAQTRGEGVQDGKMLVVYVEVVNKTQRELELSRLEYQLATRSWFTSNGSVRLSRDVGPHGTAVVEIPVPYEPRGAAGQVDFTFRGKLFATDSQVERSWSIRQDGTLEEGAIAVSPVTIETRIANGQQ